MRRAQAQQSTSLVEGEWAIHYYYRRGLEPNTETSGHLTGTENVNLGVC